MTRNLLAVAALTLIAGTAHAQYASEPDCVSGCGAGGICIDAGGEWVCTCASGYDLAGATCVDIDECVESYDAAIFTSLGAYRAAVAALDFDTTGVETFDNLGPDGTASTNLQAIATSTVLGVAFEPLWPGLSPQLPTANAVAGCGGATSSGVFAMLNNNVCALAWQGRPPGPAIRFHPIDPDLAIVAAAAFNASVDDQLVMSFHDADGNVLISAIIPPGAPAVVGVIAQVPARFVSIGPSPNNPGNGLIAFDNLEIAFRPIGGVGGSICGDDATCTNTPGGYTCTSDLCPSDPDKDAPGVCGCGELELDANEDGTVDCGYGACPPDLAPTVACGTAGVCASTFGNQTCDVLTGVITNDCDDVLPAQRIESCNGDDDDCDGAIDEGFDADCGPGAMYYAVVSDAAGVPVGTIRCHDVAGVLDCDRSTTHPDELEVYPELVCPAP